MNHPILSKMGHSAFNLARASLLMSSRRSRSRFFQNTNFNGSSLLKDGASCKNLGKQLFNLLLSVSSHKDVVLGGLLLQEQRDTNPGLLHQVLLDQHSHVADIQL